MIEIKVCRPSELKHFGTQRNRFLLNDIVAVGPIKTACVFGSPTALKSLARREAIVFVFSKCGKM